MGSRHSGQAKRDPESSSAEGGIQAILDSGFRRNDGLNELSRNLRRLGIGNLKSGFVSVFDIRISDLFFYRTGNYKNPFYLKRRRFAWINAEKHFCLDRILKICDHLRPNFFIGGVHESHRSPSGSLHRVQNLRTVLRGGKGKRRENPLESRSGISDSKAPCPGGGE
jgi:hypothetical protein